MSVFEILALAALAAAGGFTFYLYRSDTRPNSRERQGNATPLDGGEPMFARNRSRDGATGKDKPV